jgi:hypothetical protein
VSGLPSTDPAFGSTERLRPGAALQRAVTAARLNWPLDEYRAEELEQLTTDDDNDEADEATQPKEETVKRTLTNEEADTIRARGNVAAQARAVGLSNSTLATALDREPADRRKLATEVIETLLALPREVLAKHVKKQGGARAPLTKPKAVAPRATPAPTLLRPAPSPALMIETTTSTAPQVSPRVAELYLLASDEDRAAVRALLGLGGAR